MSKRKTFFPLSVATTQTIQTGSRAKQFLSQSEANKIQTPTPNLSNHTIAMRSTRRLTEMGTSYLPRGKGQPARKADKFTTICELYI
jgi:hypothetical protein